MTRSLRLEVEKMLRHFGERPECGQELPDDDGPTGHPDLSLYSDGELDELEALADECQALFERVGAHNRKVEERLAAANGDAT